MLALKSISTSFRQPRTLAALAALAALASSTGCSLTRAAVGQDNGTLRSTYISTSFRISPEMHRMEAVGLQTSAPLNHHDYALVAR